MYLDSEDTQYYRVFVYTVFDGHFVVSIIDSIRKYPVNTMNPTFMPRQYRCMYIRRR
jgi:hypothetical protein